MSPSEIDSATLGLAGAATSAVIAAAWKAFTVAARIGRMVERSEANERHIALIPGLVTLVDSLKSMVSRLASDHSGLKVGLEKLDSDFVQLRVDVARLDGSVDGLRESQSHGGGGYGE